MSMARRRGNNEGSLYHRKDGLWCAQVSLEGRRLTKYGKTQKECRDWIKETLSKIDSGLTYEGTLLTLEKFVELWLSGKELSRRPRTVFQYRKIANTHILPVMGSMKLKDIVPGHIKQLYAIKREEGTGARTLQIIHAVLHCALKQAVREGLLGRNPVDAIERPKVEQAEFNVFNEKQARQFLMAATGSTFEAVYYLALTTGMRQGELLGLKWADVDWEKSTLHVQRQLQQVEGKGYELVPPKTKAGKRQIKLGKVMLEQLMAHRKRQELAKAFAGKRWQENDLIFPTTIGTPLDHKRVTAEFKGLLQKAGLPEMRFHDLRHTSISLLLENGIPLNTVQKRAGHSKASVTADIYGHAMAGSQNQAAEDIETLVVPIAVNLQ
jgi:integrase